MEGSLKKQFDSDFAGGYARALQGFKEELEAINKKHFDYFRSRVSLSGLSDQDTLHQHYTIYATGHDVTFAFKLESDLRLEIRKACFEAYHRWFPSQR